jgi:hypothetical protein
MQLQFRFELDPVQNIAPWGDGEDRKLHWFGLTSGRYWITTPLGDALRYTEEQVKLWQRSSPYVDYQVARFFEDLESVLPHVLEPVPSDIAALVANDDWFIRAEKWIASLEVGDDRRDLCYDAMEWYQERSLDTMYLINGPIFHFWRTGDSVSVRWEPTGEKHEHIWSTPEGLFTISVAEFKSAAYSFLREVLVKMQNRVESIQMSGWHRENCKLDIPLLLKEQQQRMAFAEEQIEKRSQTDWESVMALINRLSAEF